MIGEWLALGYDRWVACQGLLWVRVKPSMLDIIFWFHIALCQFVVNFLSKGTLLAMSRDWTQPSLQIQGLTTHHSFKKTIQHRHRHVILICDMNLALTFARFAGRHESGCRVRPAPPRHGRLGRSHPLLFLPVVLRTFQDGMTGRRCSGIFSDYVMIDPSVHRTVERMLPTK